MGLVLLVLDKQLSSLLGVMGLVLLVLDKQLSSLTGCIIGDVRLLVPKCLLKQLLSVGLVGTLDWGFLSGRWSGWLQCGWSLTG